MGDDVLKAASQVAKEQADKAARRIVGSIRK
jgi:hypothetical protein